jgi:hypothetical protein
MSLSKDNQQSISNLRLAIYAIVVYLILTGIGLGTLAYSVNALWQLI